MNSRLSLRVGDAWSRGELALVLLTAAAFCAFFAQPLTSTFAVWWTDPDAGHGLLLMPVALWLGWRSGLSPEAAAHPRIGLVLQVAAVLLRIVGAIAAEAFVGRLAVLVFLVGLVVMLWGPRQLARWWLPAVLLALSIPLPEIVTGSLALPLQLQASRLGAWLLELRGIPVRLDGNVIRLPGRELFVTEACSGLRSLTALLSLAVLFGGLWLTRPAMRVLLLVVALPVGVLINGCRVFLTGFLSIFADPRLAEGFMHLTEGWLLFLVSLLVLAGTAAVLARGERWWRGPAHA